MCDLKRHSWGLDRLGRNGLERGQRLAVLLPSGECLVDLRVRFTGGKVRKRVDVYAPGGRG